MSKKKRRSSFPETSSRQAANASYYTEQVIADHPSTGLFGFFRDIGVRETIESLLVAVLLALMFRAFESEAFIIPTGSMAPSLNGQHYDLECENCQLRYHTGTDVSPKNRETDDATHCPVCRFPTQLSRDHSKKPDHKSNPGDRILVNKFVYDFSEPERFDVIVFKNPRNGKQNYIKRLIGLPGDNLAIENGDIYLYDKNGESWDRRIARKPSATLKHVLQVVDDTHHIGQYLEQANWPLRWQEFSGGNDWKVSPHDAWEWPVYQTDGQSNWIRYRHFQPHPSEWSTIQDVEGDANLPKRMQGELPKGMLISDQYAYNDLSYRGSNRPTRNVGLHWVGDIGLECDVEIGSGGGEFALDIVEGGVHFICTIDTTTGVAKLSTDTETESVVNFVDADLNEVAEPAGEISIGPGKHRLMFVNADDQLHLWVNGSLIEFDAATFTRNDVPMPYFSATDPGDAEPLGIASKGAELTIERLKVVRDLYYTSTTDSDKIANESGERDWAKIYEFLQTPDLWAKENAKDYFSARKGQKKPMFQLKKGATIAQDQFLPMGDNSPNSLDGRFWYEHHYVQRDMLIGQASFVYWPHMVNTPFRFCPNFWEMGFIR